MPNATLSRWRRRVVFSKPGSPGFRPACRQAATSSATRGRMHFSPRRSGDFWLGADICGAHRSRRHHAFRGRCRPLLPANPSGERRSVIFHSAAGSGRAGSMVRRRRGIFALDPRSSAGRSRIFRPTLDALPAPLTEASISSSNEILAIGDTMVGTLRPARHFRTRCCMLRRSNHESSAAASFLVDGGRRKLSSDGVVLARNAGSVPLFEHVDRQIGRR